MTRGSLGPDAGGRPKSGSHPLAAHPPRNLSGCDSVSAALPASCLAASVPTLQAPMSAGPRCRPAEIPRSAATMANSQASFHGHQSWSPSSMAGCAIDAAAACGFSGQGTSAQPSSCGMPARSGRRQQLVGNASSSFRTGFHSCNNAAAIFSACQQPVHSQRLEHLAWHASHAATHASPSTISTLGQPQAPHSPVSTAAVGAAAKTGEDDPRLAMRSLLDVEVESLASLAQQGQVDEALGLLQPLLAESGPGPPIEALHAVVAPLCRADRPQV